MKKLIISLGIILLSLTAVFSQQTEITVGMTGAQVRNAMNANFDSLFHGNMRNGVEIGGYKHDSRIDSGRVDGSSLKLYHGSTLLNTGGSAINVKNYGALGNGVADDRAAIIAALTATVAVNGTLYFPSGTYLISSSITTNLSNKDIIIEGDGNAKIKIPNTGAVLTFASTSSAVDYFVVAPETSLDYVVVENIAHTVSKGDMLRIKSTQNYANQGVSANWKGEIVFVQTTNGDTIFLTRPLFDWYRTDSTTIENSNAGSIHINNMKFEDIRLDLTNLRNTTVTNCEWLNPYSGCIATNGCSNLFIANNYFSRNAESPPYTAYGVGIGASQDVVFAYNHVDNFSQQIATGGFYPTRFITYAFNVFRGDENTGGDIDTHTDVQFGLIIGNYITDGNIYAGGEYIDIKDNTIITSKPRENKTGITRFREDLTNFSYRPYHIERTENITGNKIIDTPNEFGFIENTNGIMFTMSTNRDTIDRLVIADNYVDVGGYGIWMYADNYNEDHIRTLVVRDNYVRSWGYASAPALQIPRNYTYDDVLISGNEVESTTMKPAFLAPNTKRLIVENNIFRSKEAKNYVYVRYPDYVSFYNNSFDKTILDIEYNILEAVVEHNIFYGLASGDKPIFSGQDNTVVSTTLINNSYKNGCTVCVSTYYSAGLTVRDIRYLSAALTDGAPTASEINTACGSTPGGLFNGFKLVIKDTNGSGLTYTYISDGTSWILQGLPVKAL